MSKDELIDLVMEKAGLDSKAVAQRVVNAVFDGITSELAKKGEVNITNFGSFKVSYRKARMGVNPKTGEKIQIAASTAPKFKAGKGLKDAVK